MKKKEIKEEVKDWRVKPDFGGLYVTRGSKYIYISMNYFKQRLRFPTDLEDNPQNREKMRQFMNEVGEKIRKRTFCFAKTFYWLDEETKAHFSELEGNDYKPEPEHVLFGEYAEQWIQRKIPTFASVTKQRDYLEALNSRILPHFAQMPFAKITASVIETFIDELKRCDRTKDRTGENANRQKSVRPLSVKRIKNIVNPMAKIWDAACNDHSWYMRNPFSGVTEKYKEIKDRALQDRERMAVLAGDDAGEEKSTREVFLLSEWRRLLSCVDPHYQPVMELLLSGMIGSELEALQKQHIREDVIQIRCSVVRDKAGGMHLKFKPKNWYRKRDLPMTGRMKMLMEQAAACSVSPEIVAFKNGISIPANQFLLTMKDGSPFNYDSFRKTVWDKAMTEAGLSPRVPYAARHTLVQWALLVGVTKTRLVDLMGHSTKKMIDEVYGKYRQGLVDEREQILSYLGEDFLALEELRTAFPELYGRRMATKGFAPETVKAPALDVTFGQSFGQSQRLYPDNYL